MNCWWTIIGKKNWPFIWNNPFVRLLDKWEKVSLTLIDTYTFLSRPLSPLSYSLSFSQSLSTYFFPSLSLSHCISLPLSVYLSYYFSLSYSLPLSVPLFSLSIYLNFSPSPLTTSSSILLTKVSKIKGMHEKVRQKTEWYSNLSICGLERKSHYCRQFHQRYTRAFFVQIFQQSQKITRKTMFVRKICTYNVDEIDTWCPFQQQFASSFYVQKCFTPLFSAYSLVI